MKMWLPPLVLFISIPAFAQHAHHSLPHDAQSKTSAQQGHSPYTGMQSRAIKALSEQQIDDLRAGKGMSLALPAELNGYPGPAHTLELANQLALSEVQKLTMQKLLEQMLTEAKVLGEKLIARESELDRLFKEKRVNAESLKEATMKAAQVQGELRAAHLRYHLKTVDALTSAQIDKYNKLRGYQ